MSKQNRSKSVSQLEFKIEHPRTPDRNHALGGRSFYFFDFDDNVMHLPTLLFLFEKKTGKEKALSTSEFAKVGHQIGKEGSWINFEIRFDSQTGTFRRFREKEMSLFELIFRRKQPLLEDMAKTLSRVQADWKGPSWNFPILNGWTLYICVMEVETLPFITVIIVDGPRYRTSQPSIFPISGAGTFCVP